MIQTTEKQAQLACEIYDLNLKNIGTCLEILCEIERLRPETTIISDNVRVAQKDYIDNSLHYQSENALMDEDSLAEHKERILNSMEMISSAFLTLIINGMNGDQDD